MNRYANLKEAADRDDRTYVCVAIAALLLVVCVLSVFGLWRKLCPSVEPVSPLSPLAAVEGNLLANGGFEGSFVTWANSINVAPGWAPFYDTTSNPDCVAGEGECFYRCPTNCQDAHPKQECRIDYGCWIADPEFKAAALQFPERVHSGQSAQQVFWYGRQGLGGVYQQAVVEPGDRVRFSAWWQAQQCKPNDMTECDDDPGNGLMHLQVGIDPTGGTYYASPAVVWVETESWETWTQLSVEATAGDGGVVTVFLSARPDWPVIHYHNDAYVDDATLVVLETPTRTPTPTATRTPGPTPTMGPVVAWANLPIVLRDYRDIVTPSPIPTWTPTGPYTQPTMAILPPVQAIDVGESVTVAVWLGPVTDVQAIEARFFYNPATLIFESIEPGDFPLNCDVASLLKQQPGVVRFECEASVPASGAGSLATMTFRSAMTGTVTIEPWGKAIFVGVSSGWGYWPSVVTGTIVVR